MTSNPREFVRKWLMTKMVTIDERGNLQSDNNYTNDEIFGTMYLDYTEQIRDFNFKADKKITVAGADLFKMAFEERINEHVAEERKKIFSRVKFSGTEDLSQLKKFVLTLTGAEEPKVVAVFGHFIWATKRRMIGKTTFDQIMPIIFGKQKAGKSLAALHLLGPLGDLRQKLTLPQVVDSRYQMSFGRTYAVLIDEMAGSQKTDIDALKNLITANEMDIRKLHGNKVFKIKQNVNLIGTSNKPVAELIYDPTGARRFYEVKSVDRLDLQVLMKEIDYIALWQGIDETKEAGYFVTQRDAIEKDQEDLVGREELQVFLDLHKIKPGAKELSAKILYENYKSWCESNGVKNPFNSVWFGRRLSGKGFKRPHQKSLQGKNNLMYLVSDDCELHTNKPAYDPLAAKEFL